MERAGTWAAFKRHLESLGFFRMDLGLSRMRAALEALGLVRPGFFCLQVVGTNGKGSTATFLAALARARGMRCGLYTSPHFVDARERIRIDGAPVSRSLMLWSARQVLEAGGGDLTYFELLTAIALAAFRSARVELAVIEAGLGGAHDATSAIEMDACVFTPIGLDHQHILGESLEAIARDKAAALRGPVPAFSAPQLPAARDELEARATLMNAPLAFAPFRLKELPAPALCGAHQEMNAALAISAFRALFGSDAESEKAALRDAFIPGRFQRLEHEGLTLILDGAHNAHGMAALEAALRALSERPGAIVFSCLGDKNALDGFAGVLGFCGCPVFVAPVRDNPRAARPDALAERIRSLGGEACVCPDALQALKAACACARKTGRLTVLVCGSLYLLGELFARWPAWLEKPSF